MLVRLRSCPPSQVKSHLRCKTAPNLKSTTRNSMELMSQTLQADTEITLPNFMNKKEITISVINLPMCSRILNLNQWTRVQLNSNKTKLISTTPLTQTRTYMVTTSKEMQLISTPSPLLRLARDQLHFLTDNKRSFKRLIHIWMQTDSNNTRQTLCATLTIRKISSASTENQVHIQLARAPTEDFPCLLRWN